MTSCQEDFFLWESQVYKRVAHRRPAQVPRIGVQDSHPFPNSYPDSPTLSNLKEPGIKSVKEADKHQHDVKNKVGKLTQSTTQAGRDVISRTRRVIEGDTQL